MGTGEKAKNINHYLDQLHSKLVQCYQELRAEDKRITPHAIKSKFLGDDRKKRHTLKDIIDYNNANMFDRLHGNTSRLYLTSKKYILLFVKKHFKVEDIELADLDYKFILGFEAFLRGYTPRHYQKKIGNYAVMKHIQRLHRMVTLAYQLEWINHEPFRKFMQKLTPTNRTFLNSKELDRIEELNIKSGRMKSVRDLFVFSCYTGISYVDLM